MDINSRGYGTLNVLKGLKYNEFQFLLRNFNVRIEMFERPKELFEVKNIKVIFLVNSELQGPKYKIMN